MRLLFSSSNDPALNLAIEELLFFDAEQEYALLYVNRPAVVLGCNQVWMREVDRELCKSSGVELLRRITGGGTVYHDQGNLNYSFIRNKSGAGAGITADFLLPVVQVLGEMGVEAVVGKRKDLWLPSGFKISGTAAHLKGDRQIQHGTLLYDANVDLLDRVLQSPHKDVEAKGIASVPSPVKNIRTHLDEQGAHSLNAESFFHEFSLKLQQVMQVSSIETPDQQLIAAAEELAAGKYRLDEWNLRK